MTKLYIYHAHKRTLLLCKRWAHKFKGKRIQENSYPPFKRGDIVINYGCSIVPVWSKIATINNIQVLNPWDAVKLCSNKLYTLKLLEKQRVPCLEWTTDKTKAEKWERVVIRSILSGTKAAGISVLDKKKEGSSFVIPKAPLYTRYYRKTHEFRVHVFRGKVIDYTQKKRLSKESRVERNMEVDDYVRSHESGWVFCRDDIIHSDEVKELAVQAAKAADIDYCGVDILANFKGDNKEYKGSLVCEINSAPGMQKTTYLNYVKAIQELLKK